MAKKKDQEETAEDVGIALALIGERLKQLEKAYKDGFEAIKDEYSKGFSAIHEKLTGLACGEHREELRRLREGKIKQDGEIDGLKKEIKANQEHSERQDNARDTKEKRLWTVMAVVIGGLALTAVSKLMPFIFE